MLYTLFISASLLGSIPSSNQVVEPMVANWQKAEPDQPKADADYIKQESKPGGKLDFSEKYTRSSLYEYKGVAYNADQMAFISWAEAVKELGFSLKEIKVLYEEIKEISLSKVEHKALKQVFK